MSLASRVMAAAALAACLFAARPARAELRPDDAPRLDADTRVPARPLEYEVTDVDGFVFTSHPSARERVPTLVEQASQTRLELSRLLGGDLLRAVEVRVAALAAELGRLSPAGAPDPAAAAAFGDHALVVMALSGLPGQSAPDLVAVLRHELAHLALDEALERRSVPRWLHEGFASYVADEGDLARTEALASAALHGRLLRIDELEAGLSAPAAERALARAEATELVRFLLEPQRRAAFRVMLGHVRAGEPFDDALAAAYATDGPSLEDAFRADVARRYGSMPALLAGAAVWGLLGAVALVRLLRRRRALRASTPLRGHGARERAAAPLAKARGPFRFFHPSNDPGGAPFAPDAASRSASARPEEGLPRARRGLRVITLAGREIPEQVEVSGAARVEPEVPKVEHDGRWHTLH